MLSSMIQIYNITFAYDITVPIYKLTINKLKLSYKQKKKV